jgi:hypothetical protein
MSACILLIALFYLLPDEVALHFESYHHVFWLESLALIAFGVSWLTKGEAFLKDKAEETLK